MFQRLWHKLFGHDWKEIAIRFPADPEAGRPMQLTQLIKRCACGAAQSGQILGDLILLDGIIQREAGILKTTDDELAALRRIAEL
jgi:hypothetical protein